MKPHWNACRSFLRRHAEALFIIAFIVADCFAPSWFITLAASIAILAVSLPAIRNMRSLTASGRVTYLQGLVKTARVQRLGLLLFWLFSIRWLLSAAADANLFRTDGQSLSMSKSLLLAAQQFAALDFITHPILIYVVACTIAILLRTRLKATKQDPDLIRQRQLWSGTSHFLFLGAFIASVLSVTVSAGGPVRMLANWLILSACDANLFGTPISALPEGIIDVTVPQLPRVDPAGTFSDLAFAQTFENFLVVAVSLLMLSVLLQPALKLTSFLTSFCWRVVSPHSVQNIVESFLAALRLPSRALNFKEAHSFWMNAGRSLCWIAACYASLFWLFGFCGGPLGLAIQNWMLASGVDAGFGYSTSAAEWLFQPNLRIFVASVVAMYATAPLAVTGIVVLPYAKPRTLILNSDGLSFSQGPFLCLWGRQFRLWSDLKSITVKRINRKQQQQQQCAQFILSFRSGGHVSFNDKQVSWRDLKVLLEAVDQHAVACSIDQNVFAVCQELEAQDPAAAYSDGIDDSAIKMIPAQQFKSTIFVALQPGELLPTTQTRIIKQLASKPLCAVYLARAEDGRMVIVKHFYLAADTDETRAFAKLLQREYELLSRLDHPGIAKVLQSFSVDHSTYLVIEHRQGSDLRAVVDEHGARSENLVITWAKQLCEIMIYLHSRDPAIVHRDLTPDNIIAGEDGQLRLIDFGAAREFLEGTTGTMIGKQCYVAPEQLRGDATLKSDIYSFGCTLNFLLTGRDPIALSQSSPGGSVDCSEGLNRLVGECTSFEEDHRPASFEDISKRLNELDRGFKLKIPQPKAEAAA
jgi:hypothetical protein